MADFSLKDVHILIVDDDSEHLIALTPRISKFGFTVHSAGDVYSAYNLMQAKRMDLVLSDIQMPKLNGVDFLRMVRVGSADQPKFIFMSGYADYTVQELYALGGEGFFEKPFAVKSLRDAIRLTLLKREERWKMDPTRVASKTVMIDGVLLGQNDFQLGRGGFYLGFDRDLQIPVNTEVRFSVNQKPSQLMEGLGIVRWVEPKRIGVEILELWGDCRSVVVKEIEDTLPIAYIPMK